MTLSNLVDYVESLINQDLTDDTETITRTEVIAHLNTGYKWAVGAVCEISEDYYLVPTDGDTQANVSYYTLPLKTRKLDRLEIQYSAGVRARSTRIDRNAINDPSTVFDTLHPLHSLIGNNFEIFPTPTTAVTGGFTFWRIKDVDDLSGDTDVVNLPTGYEHIPALYAAGMVKIKIGLFSEGNKLLDTFNTQLEMMKEQLKPRDEGNPEYVIIRE